MARETSALELHIKVNGQNLSTISEKHNIGTLRLPSDPSWPKIPLRRSTDNIDDIIEHPCVITLTGTPRKGRSIVQTITSQHIKPRLNQKYKVPIHISERLPSYIDPRFKRQILRQKAEKPDESCNTENDKEILKLNTCALQEIKKSEDIKLQGINESVDNYTTDIDKLLDSVTKSTEKSIDPAIKKQSILETDYCTAVSQHTTKEQGDIGNKVSQERKQDSNKPLLLMVDEEKIHALPLNIEVAPSSTQSLQCYSVQIPVITYHNVPLQIPNIPTQMQERVKIPHECQDDSAKGRDTIRNIHATLKLINSIFNSNESGDEKYPLNSIQQHNTKNNNILENKNISHRDEHASDWICHKEFVNSNISLNRDTIGTILNETSLSSCHGNFNETDNMDNVRNDENSSNLNTTKKLKSDAKQGCNTNLYIADGYNERKRSSERKIAKISMHPYTNTQKQRLTYHVKNSQVNANESLINIKDKMLEKDIQDLAFNEVKDKEHGKSNNKEKHRELCTNVKRKTTLINLSKKAKSFLRKNSRLAITDSDCTLILPGSHRIKSKQYEKTRGRLKINQLLHRRNGINSTNSIRIKPNAPKKGRTNFCSLTNLQTENLCERPSSIPLETQELLNKSYWEYYWKLKCRIASTKLDNAGKRNKRPNERPRERLPECQTLQQCSVLSCVINKALQNSTVANERLSLEPTTNIIKACENVCETSGLPVIVKKIKRKKMKRSNKQLLGLKTIGIMGIIVGF